ncbi:MAG TPA: RbtT/DalT/CsbX family MFS transporter [Gryllotalpicola sp.]
MSTIPTGTAPAPAREPLLDRVGFPRGLGWGLLAVIVFLIGDGIETTWISNYLASNDGIALSEAALVVTIYGIVVAVGSFLSGALAESLGPRRVMLIGVITFLVFDLLFITVAIPSHNLALLLVIYPLRGLGYPLFGYGFLTWIMYKADPAKKGSAAGWFWFAFSLGLQVLGSYVSSLFLPRIGEVGTLWIGFAMAAIGGIGGLLLIREKFTPPQGSEKVSVLSSLVSGLSISYRVPAIGVGGIVKIINIGGVTGFSVFYVSYLVQTVHASVPGAVLMFTFVGILAVIGALGWGFLADRLGWRNTVQWFAPTLCFIAVLYLYYVPQFAGANYLLIDLGGIIFGAGLSAFVPITALMSGLAPNETGAALSIVNLGSGLAAFVGPAIVAAFLVPLGVGGVVWVFAGLYAVAFFLMFFMRLPGNARTLAGVHQDIGAELQSDTTL